MDIKKLESTVKNINFMQKDLMTLPNSKEELCTPMSSLHAIEHFGSDCYGDAIDFQGNIRVFENIYRILIKIENFITLFP